MFIGQRGDNLLLFVLQKGCYMDNEQYNEQRYNRQKQWARFILGFQQLVFHPVINFFWLIYARGIIVLIIVEKKMVAYYDANPMLENIFRGCMDIIVIIIPIICAIGLIQLIGLITALKDESDMSIVFTYKGDVKKQPPILRYKKTNRKTGVTKREFYTTIPMKRWKEKEEEFCDRMNIHLVSDITYGGKRRNIGNRIIIESAKGRKPKERGILYDDTF